MTKICTRCKETKSLECFAIRKARKAGRAPWCKSCFCTYVLARRDKEKQAAYDKKLRLENPEKYREASRRWRARGSPEAKAKSLKHIEDWTKANPDRAKQAIARWHAENPEVARLSAANRRASKVAGMPIRVSRKIIALLKAEQGSKCPYCLADLADAFEVDHFMPIALGGKHEEDNLQLTCPPCNRRKSSKHPLLFKGHGATQ